MKPFHRLLSQQAWYRTRHLDVHSLYDLIWRETRDDWVAKARSFLGTRLCGSFFPMEQNDSFSCVIADFQEAMCNPRWSRHRWSRRGWNGPGQFIELQVPDEHSKMTRPYLFITTVQGDRVPWLASQTDLLANDWYIVEGRS